MATKNTCSSLQRADSTLDLLFGPLHVKKNIANTASGQVLLEWPSTGSLKWL